MAGDRVALNTKGELTGAKLRSERGQREQLFMTYNFQVA